jgi:hypothetical protein
MTYVCKFLSGFSKTFGKGSVTRSYAYGYEGLVQNGGAGGRGDIMNWVEWLILGLAFPIAIAGYFFEGAAKKSKPDDSEDRYDGAVC